MEKQMGIAATYIGSNEGGQLDERCGVCDAPLHRVEVRRHELACLQIMVKTCVPGLTIPRTFGGAGSQGRAAAGMKARCASCNGDRRLYPECVACGSTGWMGS